MPATQPDRIRAGEYVDRPSGFRAYSPRPLPPEPQLDMDRLWQPLCEAERAAGWLTGFADTLVHPEVFARFGLLREAIFSSRVDGIEVPIGELLAWEREDAAHGGPASTRVSPGAIRLTANTAAAAEWGFSEIRRRRRMSVTLIRELHTRLYESIGIRDEDRGRLRTSDVWIGPRGSTLQKALYVPPTPIEVDELMVNLEVFSKGDGSMPPLVMGACAYYQIETIHPFVEGTGRIARLAIALLLCQERLLWPQFMSLSSYFSRDRAEHFRLLQRVREHGEWEEWVLYFLRGVRESAEEGVDLLRRLRTLRTRHREMIRQRLGGSAGPGLALLDFMLGHPVLSVASAAEAAARSFANANTLVRRFVDMGILREVTGRRRNRRYVYEPFLHLISG